MGIHISLAAILAGVHISLVICVRGYTYHGGTHRLWGVGEPGFKLTDA